MLYIVTRDRGGRDDVMRKSPIGGASANSKWSSTSVLGASTSTVQAQWSLSDMRYSLRSSHRYAFLKVIFTVLKI